MTLLLCFLSGLVGGVYAQSAVGVLRSTVPAVPYDVVVDLDVKAATPAAQPFYLARNLIFVTASIDGRPGRFILDTGAPGLLINDRADCVSTAGRQGIGAGGTVRMHDHRVDRFSFADHSVRNYWALGLDLSGFENRTQRKIDGLIGYDMLKGGELRIDYGTETFSLLPSERRPKHRGRRPAVTLRFQLLGHLPVIQLEIDGKVRYFAIDTGAGVNLVDRRLAESVPAFTVTGQTINIQGLDGHTQNEQEYRLATMDAFPNSGEDMHFLSVDMDHLQEADGPRLSGIIGSDFLRRFTVGIDYRRRRLHLW